MLELAASLLTPVAGPITHPVTDDHPALDIACRNGAEVRAAHDGLGKPSWDNRMGWTFVLQGERGLRSSYSHLKQALPQGPYKRGDVIGLCGNTGSWSSGTHLHFAMEPTGNLQNFTSFAPPLPEDQRLARKEPVLLTRIKNLGIHVDRLERCGLGNELAAYNRAAQRLCLVQTLDTNPGLFETVVTHETVHVIQDCLGGLQTSQAKSIAGHLKTQGGFSDTTIAKFFDQNLRDKHQVSQATASLTADQSQLEFEAYALQHQGALVASLLNSRCPLAPRGQSSASKP